MKKGNCQFQPLTGCGTFSPWHSLQLCWAVMPYIAEGSLRDEENLPSFQSFNIMTVFIATSAVILAHRSFLSGLPNDFWAASVHLPTEIWHRGEALMVCILTSALGRAGTYSGSSVSLYHLRSSLMICLPTS